MGAENSPRAASACLPPDSRGETSGSVPGFSLPYLAQGPPSAHPELQHPLHHPHPKMQASPGKEHGLNNNSYYSPARPSPVLLQQEFSTNLLHTVESVS